MSNFSTLPTLFVINLDRSVSRLEAIKTRLNLLSLVWERVSAVDGSLLDVNNTPLLDTNRFHHQHGKPVLPGELGCYLSHVEAMQCFLKSSKEHAVIVEDDVMIGENFPKVLAAALEHKNEWDLIKFSGIHSGHPLKMKFLCEGFQMAVATTSYTGASCYAVNRKAAEILVKALLPMSLPYDLAYDRGWETGLKVRMVSPAPCEHSFAMGSELHPKGVVRKNFHWTQRLNTHAWRIKTHLQRLMYGLSQYLRHRGDSV